MIIEHDSGLLLSRTNHLGERKWRSDSVYKFIYSPKGNCYYQTNRGDITVNRECFIIFNPADEHKQLKVDHEKFLIELSPTFLKEMMESLGVKQNNELLFATFSYQHHAFTQWVGFVKEYISLSQESDEKELSIFFEHSLSQLSLLLMKYTVGNHNFSFPSNSIERSSYPLNKVISAMKEGFKEAWTLDQIAEIAGMNKYQFARLFKEKLGVSPYSWLQIYRVVKCQAMLVETNKSITEISFEAGFSSISMFNGLFKRLYGMTPSDFRKLSR